MDLATQLLLCLTTAALCGGLVRVVPLPLAVVQTFAGAVVALLLGVHIELEPHAFLLVLIPPLLYFDAWRMPKAEFRRNRTTIFLMAFGLVAITVLCVGSLADWLVPAVPRPVAFAIAAALSTTDHLAVGGITGKTPMPPRLATILQGEALFCDATGLVALRFAIAAMITGAFSWPRALGSLVLVSLGGIAVGVVLAWLFVRLLRFVLGKAEGDVAPRVLLMMLFPYAAYLVAEHFELSGVLAAVAAGMVANRFELIDADHRATRLQSGAVLHMMEDALNGLVFVLLGLQLPTIVKEIDAIAADAQLSHVGLALAIAAVIGALGAIRFAWVWVSFRLSSRRRKPALRLVAATALGGVRGAVTLASALSLPIALADGSRFPAREVAIFVCAVVIVVWLIVASIGLPILLPRCEDPESDDHDLRIRGQLAEAAIAALENEPPSTAVGHVIELYRARLRPDQPDIERRLRIVAIAAERAKLRELRLDEATFARYLRELDLIEEAL
jgi:monovalent cation/hydrogen antiporter